MHNNFFIGTTLFSASSFFPKLMLFLPNADSLLLCCFFNNARVYVVAYCFHCWMFCVPQPPPHTRVVKEVRGTASW